MASSLEKKPYTIFVEGNIGAGKTTFLKYLTQFEHIDVISEPIEQYRNLNGNNMLDLLYTDTKKWAFPFQTYVHLLMLENYLKPTAKKTKIMERSPFSAQYIFVELLRQNKQIEKEEYDILQKWNDFTTGNFAVKPNLIVYLRAEPRVAFERVKMRARSEENKVGFDYIQQIHELHEKWLLECNDEPVLILNANQSAHEVQQQFEKSEYASKLNKQ